jgi:O-antigen ligase
MLMTLCWLCAHLTSTLGLAKGRNPIRTALYLYGISLLATYCSATYHFLVPNEVDAADHALVLIVALLGATLLICDGVRTRERLDLLLKTVAVGTGVVAVVGALQFVVDFDLTEHLAIPGLGFSSVASGFILERSDFRRVAGTTGSPIEFGVLCAMTLPLALHYGFRAKDTGRTAWRWWVLCLLIASGLLFSISRSAVLGVACIGLVLLPGWPARRRIHAVVVTVVFLGISRFLFPGLLGTLLGLFLNFGSDDSVSYRTHDYPVAAAEISRNFWLGHGVGTFYAPQHIVFDNQYLLTLVESGVLGGAALAILFLTGMGAALRMVLRSAQVRDRQLALSLMACLSVPIVDSVTFDLLSFKITEGVLFVVLGSIGALYRMAEWRPRREPRPAPAGRAPGSPRAVLEETL